ncbi:MAG TPA: retropepsin-like aspartic protease [Acetobacteraceae bacterium]|jgi:predicted aspartyl protease|nr:retropepsin-like aspartic protease [Acetobacteraceae bacterium]
MHRVASLLLLLLLALAGCATPPPSCDLVALAAMPLEAHNNLMFVTAGIGGRPVRLLVDTGAERTVLTEAAAARLGLQHDAHHMTRSFGIGGSSANWDVDIPGLTLGQTHFPVPRLAVGKFSIDHAGGLPVDGLLGADVLLAFDMDIDAPGHRLTLYRVRRCPYLKPPWEEPSFEIPGVEARRDRLLVPIELDRVSGMAVLDTGAQATTVGIAMARRLGLTEPLLANDKEIMAHGASPQPVAVHLHRFRELVVGDARIEAPTLAVVPQDSAMGDALLGGDFLHGRRVWLSFPTRRLFVSMEGTSRLAAAR